MTLKSIYIMRDGDKYKIGVSQNPRVRLGQFLVGNSNIELFYESEPTANAFAIESKIHKKYKDFSCGGEWFLLKDVGRTIREIEQIVGEQEELKEESVDITKRVEKLIEKSGGKNLEQLKQEVKEIKLENKRQLEFFYCIFGMIADSEYSDLIYLSVFGKSAKQLREQFGISKDDNLRDRFTTEELAMVKNLELMASGLMSNGWGYEEIKEIIMSHPPKGIEME